MMQLGVDGVFVGSGIFKSGNPAKCAHAIVQAVTHFNDPKILAEVSENLGAPMVGINLDTGNFRVTRFVVAHDCGHVINPMSLNGTIEANLMQALSRAKHEQVMFTATRVTSVDWATYPMLDMTEVPDAVDIVLLNNRPDAKPLGAGEPATRPVAAVIANALFDATGVRIRRVPFTAESLKAAFKSSKVAA